jgi:hypothetical protein
MRLDRLKRLIRCETKTAFVLGAYQHSVPICMYPCWFCVQVAHLIDHNLVITAETTANMVLETLWLRGYLPGTYQTTHLLFASGCRPLAGTDRMGDVGIGSLSHLHLRMRCPGGASHSGKLSSNVIYA